jgi:mannose-6-phosphate isomerase-like protein (cupin superfamily)
MSLEKINMKKKLAAINDYWDPKIAGKLNGQLIKFVKFKGEFVWHKHDNEDEMFLVLNGNFTMEHRDKKIEMNEGEFIIIPKGTEHRPVANSEVHVMLFEPELTLNTGDAPNSELTKVNLEEI